MRKLLMAMLIAGPAAASTPAEWTKAGEAAAQACRKASDLNYAKVLGSPLVFSDRTAQTALLVTGTWKPKHMKGARATMLCLYDRRTKQAETVEAPGWSVR